MSDQHSIVKKTNTRKMKRKDKEKLTLDEDKLADIMFLVRSLEQQRNSWEGIWLDTRDNIYPESGRALGGANNTNNGVNRQSKILDSKPQLAIRNLATGMQGGLISPSRQWFNLGLKGEQILTPSIKAWLKKVKEVLEKYFNQADIYGAMYQLFREMALYGQGVLLIEEHLHKAFKFTTLSCGDYWLDTNDDDEVDTLMRKIYYSARDLVRKFGKDNVPEFITEKEKFNNVEKRYEVLHIIKPRENFDPSKKDTHNMPYEELYLLRGKNTSDGDKSCEVLRHSGYKEKPFVAPRWEKTSGCVYGSCPSRIALPDIQTLYQIRKDGLNALKKEARPPMTASASMKNNTIDLGPDGVTFVSRQSTDSQFVPTQQVRGVYQTIEGAILAYHKQIQEVFFNDLFAPIMNRDKSMSATEVQAVNSEKLGSITPVIELLEKEALDPIFERCFNILMNLNDPNVIPEIPQELAGKHIQVDYISVLAQAQKRAELSTLLELVTDTMALAQAKPEAVDWLNIDKIMERLAEILCHSDMILSKEEVKKLRKMRQKVQQAQQSKESAGQAISMAEAASNINTDNLSKIAGQVSELGAAA